MFPVRIPFGVLKPFFIKLREFTVTAARLLNSLKHLSHWKNNNCLKADSDILAGRGNGREPIVSRAWNVEGGPQHSISTRVTFTFPIRWSGLGLGKGCWNRGVSGNRRKRPPLTTGSWNLLVDQPSAPLSYMPTHSHASLQQTFYQNTGAGIRHWWTFLTPMTDAVKSSFMFRLRRVWALPRQLFSWVRFCSCALSHTGPSTVPLLHPCFHRFICTRWSVHL